MSDLFDYVESQKRKADGMAMAANNHMTNLEIGKDVARQLGRKNGEAHADQVGKILKIEYDIKSLAPAAGSLFKGDEWQFTGRRHMSTRKTNHGRELKIWRYLK